MFKARVIFSSKSKLTILVQKFVNFKSKEELDKQIKERFEVLKLDRPYMTECEIDYR